MKVVLHLHLFFFISCSNVTNTFDYVHFEKVDSILVEMPYAYDWFATMSIQAYERDGDSYIMISDIYKKKLIEIDRRAGFVSNVVELDFMANDRFPIFLFHYINIDSILILRDPSFDRKFMDSAFFFVNMQGEKFGHINLSDSQMNLRYESISDSGRSSYSHLFYPLTVIDDNLIIHTVPFNNFDTDFQLIKKHNIPYFGQVNIRSQSPSYNRIDYFPNFEVVGNYPRNQKRLNYIGGNSNEIIFSYPFEVHPKKYNFVTNKLMVGKTRNQDFLLIDAPQELPDSVNEQDFEFVQHSFFYSKAIYDKKIHNTFRFAYLPFEIEGLDVATINEVRKNRVVFIVFYYNI
ncbi:MAG: hypothetical protein JJU02_10780 [Cryomorphaceae bacterium]|nr:hypothetical protein [Cryomorphaceae bacterium]